MSRWAADWTCDSNDDFNFILAIHHDGSDDIAVIKQSQQGLILKWYISPKGLFIPVEWFSGLLKAGKKDIVDPTTIVEEIYINMWTATLTNETFNDNAPICKIFCDDEEVAVVKQSQQGLILDWHTTPKGLIMPVDWLSDLLLKVIAETKDMT